VENKGSIIPVVLLAAGVLPRKGDVVMLIYQ
jgi:hypothetical protein